MSKKWNNDKMKSINIHGKEYYEVKERVQEFHRRYENGSIETEIIELTDTRFITRTIVKPDEHSVYSGLACEVIGSGGFSGSELECCETSSVGRALGFLNIGITNSIASADEVRRAKDSNGGGSDSKEQKPASEKQIKYIMKLCADKSVDTGFADFDNIDMKLAGTLIELLMAKKDFNKDKILELLKSTLSEEVQEKIDNKEEAKEEKAELPDYVEKLPQEEDIPF